MKIEKMESVVAPLPLWVYIGYMCVTIAIAVSPL
jgi:hypothetical protein